MRSRTGISFLSGFIFILIFSIMYQQTKKHSVVQDAIVADHLFVLLNDIF